MHYFTVIHMEAHLTLSVVHAHSVWLLEFLTVSVASDCLKNALVLSAYCILQMIDKDVD